MLQTEISFVLLGARRTAVVSKQHAKLHAELETRESEVSKTPKTFENGPIGTKIEQFKVGADPSF